MLRDPGFADLRHLEFELEIQIGIRRIRPLEAPDVQVIGDPGRPEYPVSRIPCPESRVPSLSDLC